MDTFDSVLCFCPSSRLSAASLVLSTWTGVRRYVLTDDEKRASDAAGFSAAVVMDHYVTREIVERLAARMPVVLLAWNGLFEIERYRAMLADLDIIYMGTDESLERDVPIRYLPMVNGHCSYTRWRDLYQHKQQFTAEGHASYRARWLRARLQPNRALSVLISAAGSARRPRALRRTLESAVISNKLVWAGNCYLDFPDIGLSDSERRSIETRIAAVAAQSSPSARLQASVQLLDEWKSLAENVLGPERAHQAFYVSNTLLRWTVLGFLSATAKSSTWFFGRDNLGLGLELELYVHNLVRSENVAFLEFGGKTSETALYPRSLHMLRRQFYVIAIGLPEAGEPVTATLERIHRGLESGAHAFFARLEERRRMLYGGIDADMELHQVQKRVWGDFALA